LIKFGTDGWRGIIADDFNFYNLQRVAVAIALYLKEEGLKEPVFIGYDTRFLSEKFARKVAETLASYEIRTLFGKRFYPTPITAFAARHFNLSGAVMITASHNPCFYNGVKFIPSYGGPASLEITSRIESLIPREVEERSFEEKFIEDFDPFPAYFKHLEKVIDFDLIARSNLRVVFNPNYGAAIGLFEKIFSSGNLTFFVVNNFRDPYFGGGSPDPDRKNLEALLNTVNQKEAQAGFSLDGDADRFGVVEAPGSLFSTNELLSILAYYLLEIKKERGNLVRTVATTHLLDRLAKDYGVSLIETPVGFKYIAEVMMKEGLLLGGEESGGMTVQNHIPEKDGILAVLLCLEALAQGKSFTRFRKELKERFGPLFSCRYDFLISEEKKEKLKLLIRMPPEEIKEDKLRQLRVGEINQTDGLKVILADGSWFLLRLSGTEPVARLYIESDSEGRLEDLKNTALELFDLGRKKN